MKPSLTAQGMFYAFMLLAIAPSDAQTIYSPYAISSLAATNGVLFYNTPYDVAAAPDGTLYVAATYDYTIWKLTRNSSNSLWTSTLFAGSSGNAGASDGVGSAARFTYPQCVAVDTNGNVFVGDSGNHLIRQITPDGNVTTIGQGPNVGYCTGLAVDKNGTVYFTDNSDGIGVVGGGGASRIATGIYYNGGIAINTNGDIFTTDEFRHVIRKGATIIAGTDGVTGSADGIGTAAQFNTPDDLALDAAGNIYVADTGNDLLRKITFDGTNWIVRTMAGVAGVSGNTDGSGSAARFWWPTGITVDSAGTVYTAEVKTFRIRAAVYDGPTNAANIWTNSTNGKWEVGLSWTIGYPTVEDEVDYITNDLSKAVVIDANTVTGRPQSLTVNNLVVYAPDNYINGLALFNAGLSTPLHIKQQLAIDSGGSVALTNSAMLIDVGLSVGYYNGGAVLSVYNGGRLTSTASYIGYNSDSSAAQVGGINALWTNKTFLAIGANSDNNGLLIENGGAVGSQTTYIGTNGNNNSVVVTGVNSVWRNPGLFIVGAAGGSGNSLTIVNGGAVYTGNTGMQIGTGGDGNVVTISDANSLLSCPGALLLTRPVQSTYNALYVGAGATVTTSSLTVSNGNFVGIAGGTLNTSATIVDNGVVFPIGVGEQTATLHLNGGVHTFAAGLEITDHALLTGCGIINGPVTVDPGGTVLCDRGCSIIFNGPVTNKGTIQPLDGTNITFSTYLINYGSLPTNTPPPPSPCLTVTNGNIVNLADSATYTITVETNSAQFSWSLAGPGASGYVYATSTTHVAPGTGVTNIAQVTNASAFTFATTAGSAIGPFKDAGANGGIGQFVILRNKNTTNYAVVRFDDVQSNGSLNATWWFQKQRGTSDFSCGAASTNTGPIAVSNLVAHVDSSNLGVSFSTQPQHAYTVQVRSNLSSGVWKSYTNFTGDGTLHEIPLPITPPAGFYRVLTQ